MAKFAFVFEYHAPIKDQHVSFTGDTLAEAIRSPATQLYNPVRRGKLLEVWSLETKNRIWTIGDPDWQDS